MQKYDVLQTLTSHSSILWMALKTVSKSANFRTISKVSLIANAANNMEMNCSIASTKMGVTEGNCICWIKALFIFCISVSLLRYNAVLVETYSAQE